MDNPLVSAIEESLPSDEQAVSSPAPEQPEAAAPVETPTPKVEQETPFHEHPRWKEVIEERNYWREMANKAIDRPVQAPQPQVDPYAGMDPQERAAWERIQQIARKEAETIVSQKEQLLTKELNANREALAAIAYRDFQKAHPDVAPNSPEEVAIANWVARGYTLDNAYKVVMFDKAQQRTAQQVKQQVTSKTQQKIAANVETSSVAPNALPNKKKNFREAADDLLKQSGW